MESPQVPLTLEEIRAFHEKYRAIYCFLTMTLWRNPFMSVQVMAVWLWLERVGFDTLINSILFQSESFINQIADEATNYLHYLSSPNMINEYIQLPKTQGLLSNIMPPKIFFLNQDSAAIGIRNTLTKVCMHVFKDLRQQTKERNHSTSMAENQVATSAAIAANRLSGLNINAPRRVNPQSNHVPRVVEPQDRTLFATFSRGHPLSESDIHDFFDPIYGDCIESIQLGNGEHPISARVVLKDVLVMEDLLYWCPTAKVMVNGKHLWMHNLRLSPGDRCRLARGLVHLAPGPVHN